MSAAAEERPALRAAWQPFTFGGVAAFAGARLARLLAFALAAAVLLSSTTVWFVHRAYNPVILQFVQKMPETAKVAHGSLQGMPETLIAESKFLAIVATPKAGGEIGQDADLQIQLRQDDFCAGSVFWPDWGLELEYGREASFSLARSNLEPWWSAWQPVLLLGTGAAMVLFLLVFWGLLAALYMAPAKFIAWFADRGLTWGGAWRLALAALLPGALVLAGSVLLYGWNAIDLVGLSFLLTVHMIMGWIYLIGGVCKARRLSSDDSKGNPFIA